MKTIGAISTNNIMLNTLPRQKNKQGKLEHMEEQRFLDYTFKRDKYIACKFSYFFDISITPFL